MNLTPASFAVRVAGQSAPVVSFADFVLIFRIPVGLVTGPATTDITAAGETLPPVLLAVDLPPPVIASATSGTAARPAAPGDLVAIHVNGLTEGREGVDPQRLTLTVGAVAAHIVQSPLTPLGTPPVGTGHDVQFELDAKQAPGTLPVVISLDGRSSAPFPLVIR